jgi:hypothetical protein
MAGSWEHMTTKSGRLLGNERFAQVIGNLGDAYEAAEECFGMVWYLADMIAAQLNGTPRPTRRQTLDVIRQAQESYEAGVRMGEVSRPR